MEGTYQQTGYTTNQVAYQTAQYATQGYTVEQPTREVVYTTSNPVTYTTGSTAGQQVVYTTGVPATTTTYTYEQQPATTTTTTYVTGEKAVPVNGRYYSGTYPTGGNTTYDYTYTTDQYTVAKWLWFLLHKIAINF